MRNRWISLAAGVAIQTVLGGIYAWSTFSPKLSASYGLEKGEAALIFGLSVACFTITMTVAGKVFSVLGPRLTAGLGAALYAGGYLLASVTEGSFAMLLLSLGAFAGTGTGLGYVCPLTVGIKWFPRNKGLVTGIAVAGFGGGAILLSTIATYSFNSGMDALAFFRVWGILAGMILFASALLLTEPERIDGPIKKQKTLPSVMTAQFWLCAFGIFVGTFSGLLLNGNLAPLSEDAGIDNARVHVAISLFSAGNAFGRIAWGMLFDRFGYKTIPYSLISLALAIIPVILGISHSLFLIFIFLIGFCFGANFVVYASTIAKFFGQSLFPSLYPLCFLSYGLAGVLGPWFGGHYAEITDSFRIPLLICSLSLVLAGGLLFAKLAVFDRESVTETETQR